MTTVVALFLSLPFTRCLVGRPRAWGTASGLHCAAPRFARGSLRCSGSQPGGITHCARFARSVQTDAASQFTKRAARAGRLPCAPRLRTGVPTPCPKPLATEVRACQRWHAQVCVVRPGPLAAQAPMRCREAQGGRPRAQRASSSDWRHLFERSAQSARSELCRRPSARASQGTLRAAKGAAFEAGAARGPGLTPPTKVERNPALQTKLAR